MTLAERIDLAPAARIPGGILENATPLPEGWEQGIAFLSTRCTEPEISLPCVITDRTEIRPGDPNTFEPIFINQSAGCSTLSRLGLVDMAADRLESTTEWALGRALATGVGSTNPTLADATSVHDDAADDVVNALSCLEQAVADLGFGADAVLHAPFRAAAFLRSCHLIERIGDQFYSPTGLRWVISSGYPATSTEVTIWATGGLWLGVTDAYPLSGVDGRPTTGWRTNSGAAYAQRLGLVAFDPCLNLSATFTVPACNGGS